MLIDIAFFHDPGFLIFMRILPKGGESKNRMFFKEIRTL